MEHDHPNPQNPDLAPESVRRRLQSVVFGAFPWACYNSDARLLLMYPRGALDENMFQSIAAFTEAEELIAGEPFNRYTDLTGITDVRFKAAETFALADRRRRGYRGMPVKSAFFSEWHVTLSIVRLYRELLRGALIEVRAFARRDAAARWLDVSEDALESGP